MSQLQIYKASAGSGKTYTLALEYIRQLIAGDADKGHRRILAVTFTKDATGEMKDRILAELYGLAFGTEDSAVFLQSLRDKLKKDGILLSETEIRERAGRALQQILHDYSHLNVTTIDSFFQRVLRNLARELGASSRFNLEMNTGKVLSEAVNAMIEKALPNTPTLEWLATYVENKLEEGKSWNITKEILDFSYCIYNEYFQQHEATLRQQLKENPHTFAQLHKSLNAIIHKSRQVFEENGRQYASLLRNNGLEPADISYGKELPSLYIKLANNPDKVEISSRMKARTQSGDAWAGKNSPRRNEITALAERELIPLLKETFGELESYRTARMIMGNLHQLGLVWDISNELSRKNKETNRFMLSDTAQFLNRMIDGSDAPFIFEKIGAEVKHVMIDEFQDTSRLQWENFKALLADILAANNYSLLVGDVKQSIYRWRNGDWRILNGIEDELGVLSDVLPNNYRSEKRVVGFNNRFFTEAGRILDREFYSLTGETPSPFARAYAEESVTQHPNRQQERGFVSVDFVPSKDEDGNLYSELMLKATADKLRLLYQSGVKAADICILTRKNSQIAGIGNYLASIREDNPDMAQAHYLDLVSGEAFLLNSSIALKIIIEAMRCIAAPEDRISRTRLEFFLSIANDTDAKEAVERMDARIETLERMPLYELVNRLFLLFSLGQIQGQSPYLFTFQDALINYMKDGKGDLPDFIRYWDEDLSHQTIPAAEGVDGIRAMTIHKSKGLQFHTVLIPYCDWRLGPALPPVVWCGPKPPFYHLSLMPISYSKAMDGSIFKDEYREETVQNWMDNLNVLYVAFTRAEKNLIIIGKESKNLDEPTTVSDLLAQIVEGEGNKEKGESSLSCGEGGGRGEITPSLVKRDLGRDEKAPSLVERVGGEVKETNPLKEVPRPMNVSYNSFEPKREGSIFKQSNQSYEFLYPERPSKEHYTAYGNIMHKLFEYIITQDDIEPAIDRLIAEGNIHPSEKKDYQTKIEQAINSPDAHDWFSGTYKVFSECTILTLENNEVIRKRPDRVLLSDTETKVIDFKFGQPHPSHTRQINEYVSLLESMGYPHVQGFVWYVR